MTWDAADYVDPVRFTAPLEAREDGLPVHSDGYDLLLLAERYWPVRLDIWQQRLIIRVLETRGKDGPLRYRQVLVSIARQNGKSEIGGVLALYGLLMMVKGAQVIGIASNVDQANLIYDRVSSCINNSKALSKVLHTTRSRGITGLGLNTASYKLKAAKPGAVQGQPVNLGLVDELHLETAGQCWDDLVNGQGAQEHSLVIALTTAGDNTSKTLLRLYETAAVAIGDPSTSFGAFIYEGATGAAPDDVQSILAANPSIACGRRSLQERLDVIATQPDFKVRRYTHNLFVDSDNPFVDPAVWAACAGQGPEDTARAVIGIDVSQGWRYGAIVASTKDATGQVHAELVQWLTEPSQEVLEAAVDAIHKEGYAYAMDTNLKDLSDYLRSKGREVHTMNNGGYLRATEMGYSLIAQNKVTWNKDDVLLDYQMRHAKTKVVSGREAIARGPVENDAVRAFLWSIYVANTRKELPMQLF
ncbi:terminase large subunit domain-containing protein [Aeromicrobium sp. Leaf272]|uniref:terminase large subunit domain-containing protein n=1 Tax=Aeromicrobium sp. Leaf272 TaxID=1736317 RepID=UPI0009E98F20|nr:terminase large subunit [Aeromicrobium sp. Leaf272]